MNRTEVINRLIQDNGYTSYLEIGVYDGKNFNDAKKVYDDFYAINDSW